MSTDETTLLFEGYLKKRKDKMKMKWATYWFRLQNTTLFFYTKKDARASHLRGLYYIYTVQSVREVQRDDSKRFVFEITMTSGKKKVLAAETAALRKEWMGQLWRAMSLSNSRGSVSGRTHLDVFEQRGTGQSSSYSSSDCHGEAGPLGGGPAPSPTPPDQKRRETFPFPVELNSEETIHKNNTLSTCERFSGAHLSSSFLSVEDRQEETEETEEGDYDVLPPRKSMYDIQEISEEEDVYDIPLSNRRAGGHQEHRETESIYDVPSSLLRKMTEHALEDQLEGGESLLEDMMVSLGGESAGWLAASNGPNMPVYF